LTERTTDLWLWPPGLTEPQPLSVETVQKHVPHTLARVVKTILHHAPTAKNGNLQVWSHWLQRDAFMPPGVIRFSTQGRIVAELISQWQLMIAGQDLFGERIESPTLYRYDEDAPLLRLAARFSDRLYHSDELILKYGADPGYFGFLGSQQISRKHLPLRVFELAKGFRRSQAGELRGIERLAEFDILEHHTLTESSQALPEYERQLSIQLDRHKEFDDGFICYFRTLDPASDLVDNPVIRMAAERVPTVIKALPSSMNYWSLTHTLYTSEGVSTFHSQLDQVNARRFDVIVPGVPDLAIIHTALGSLQHMMLTAESVALQKQHSELPIWLTPVQARFVPVRPDCVGLCVALREALGSEIRADVDDRPRSVGWRVRRALAEWIPYTLVIGPDETAARLRVRLRDGTTTETDLATLRDWITSRVAGYPRVPLGYILVSRRVPLGSHLD
jgi:threonyl-tRNA synthetase